MIQVVNDYSVGRLGAMYEGDDFCIPRAGETRMPLLLARAGAFLVDTADELLAPAGVDGRGYQVLAILATDGPGSQLELAKLLGKAPALIVAAIDQLEAQGFVERTRDPADRRRSRVMLTKAGERALGAPTSSPTRRPPSCSAGWTPASWPSCTTCCCAAWASPTAPARPWPAETDRHLAFRACSAASTVLATASRTR